MAERIGKEMDFGALVMAGEKDPQKIAAAKAEFEGALAQIDGKIKVFLNHDSDYQIYKRWEETKNERIQLNMSSAAFLSAGEPLSLDQEDQLVTAMFEARKSSQSLPDISKPENLNEANFSPEMLERQMKNFDRQSEELAQKAAGFLSPKQLEAFQSARKNQRAMQEMGLKMMSSGALKIGEKTEPK